MSGTRGVRQFTLCVAIVAAIALSLGQGCPAPSGGSGTDPLPGSSTISEVITSGAVVGSTGRIRVTLVDPVASETTVTLTALNPSVATVPATLTIVAGSDTGEAVYTGVAQGATYLIASLGSSAKTSSLDVVTELQLTSVSAGTSYQAGASGTLGLYLNIAVASNTPVSLTSSNPAVVSVPATIAFNEFESTEYLPFIAGIPGTTVITATLGSSQASTRITVASGIAIAYLSLSSAKLQTGASGSLTLALGSAPAATTAVSLVSSDPAVMAVPDALIFPAGTSYMTVPVIAGNVGSATLTALLAGNSVSNTVNVVGTVFIDALGPVSTIEVGAVSPVRLTTDAAVAVDTPVAITVSPPGIISVPASVLIPAGSSYAYLTGLGLAAGNANVTATMPGSTRSTSAMVVAQAAVGSVTATPAKVGSASTISVNLTAVAAADRTITIGNSNPAAFVTPATVVVPSGASNVSFSVIGLAAVPTTLSATLAPNPPVLSAPIVPAP